MATESIGILTVRSQDLNTWLASYLKLPVGTFVAFGQLVDDGTKIEVPYRTSTEIQPEAPTADIKGVVTSGSAMPVNP